jgi:hypothetical protein
VFRAIPFEEVGTLIPGKVRDQIFFEPRQLSGQLSDLSVEFIDLLFVFIFHFRDAFTIVDEQLREILNSLQLPSIQNISMNAMLGRELRNRLFFL